MLGPLVVALLLFTSTIWSLQILRLGYHLLGDELAVLARILCYSLPTLLVFTFPLATASAILFALLRLGASGQLLAMQAAGLSFRRLALPGGVLGLLGALSVHLISAHLEPQALAHLQQSLKQSATRVLVLRAKPGLFVELWDGVTLYVEQRRRLSSTETEFHGFFLAQDSRVIVAEKARARLVGDQLLELMLSDGEEQSVNRQGGLRRLQYASLRLRLDLAPALRPHLGFLAALAAERTRAMTGPLSCLALSALALALGLSRMSRLRLVAVFFIAGAGYLCGLWGIQAVWPGLVGSALWSAGVILVCCARLTWR
jgi:lipopolysaccharide export LptBFGC system permease protein LptF